MIPTSLKNADERFFHPNQNTRFMCRWQRWRGRCWVIMEGIREPLVSPRWEWDWCAILTQWCLPFHPLGEVFCSCWSNWPCWHPTLELAGPACALMLWVLQVSGWEAVSKAVQLNLQSTSPHSRQPYLILNFMSNHTETHYWLIGTGKEKNDHICYF